MVNLLRVLAIEDEEDDLMVLVYTLQRSGYQLIYERVENAQSMNDALDRQEWDIIICDYVLPSFSVSAALKLMQSKGFDLPFIIVSSSVSEEIAVEALKAGADDFVPKNRMARLIPAIERSRREAESRRKRKQAETALKQSEEHLRLALSAAHMGTWDWDLLTNKVVWSTGHEHLFGLTPGTFNGTYETFEACVHPEDRASIIQAVNEARQNRQKYQHQFRVVWPDSSIHWIEGQGNFFYNAEGQAVRMLGIVMNISDRKLAEEKLRQANEELENRVAERTIELTQANKHLQRELVERKRAEEERAQLIDILEATPDIIAGATVDLQARYLNSAARKLFGLSEDEDVASMTITDAHPDWMHDFVCNEAIPAALRDGTWVGETTFLSHDGKEIPTSQLIIAHKSADGSVKHISTIARDITQQKLITGTLLEAERRWRTLLENVRLVVVGLDQNGLIEYVNPFFLELVGYTKAEVIGKNWFEAFVPHHQAQRVQRTFSEILEHNLHSYYQNTILTKEGEEKIIAWNNTLLRNLQGQPIGTLSIGEDITERNAIERMKDEFISVVSHELRTPLTSIHGALNLLSTGLVQPQSEKGQRVIGIAAESAERLVRLVNDILELERLESGKIKLSKQICDVGALTNHAAETMQVMANRAGISLHVSPQTIEVNADSDRIIQVLTNLLNNAIKFSPDGASVWLSVKQIAAESDSSTASVLFEVKDTGRGIPPEKLETIFERFHQVDASDSRKKGGTGLGLAICRSIVQQHGGRIWVESTPGEGSSFYFTLPSTGGSLIGDAV